jgi:hypothetical protein
VIPKMIAGAKRPRSEFDQPPSNPLKKIRSNEDTISSLLAEIEAEFQRRQNTKEEAFMKWEHEGTPIYPPPPSSTPSDPFFNFYLLLRIPCKC